jgi:fatty acid CoA ligase FadD36
VTRVQALDRWATADVEVAGQRLAGDALAGAVGAVAARLTGAGVVALEAASTLETVIGVLGALAAGATVVPVPADAGRSERRHLLTDAGVVATVHAAGSPAGEGPVGELVPVDPTDRATLSVAGRPPDRPALMLYTSGTTGPPKGVPITAGAVDACLDGLAEAWAWTPEDVLAHGLPLFHVHGLVLGVLGALHVGSPLVHTGRPTPAAYAGAAERGASLFFAVPTVWSRVAADASVAAALRPARLLVSGSAPLPLPVYESLGNGCGQAPVERYGMTETLITLSVRADGERRPGWVGVPLPGTRTRVVDDAGRPVPADGESVGDLLVAGPTVMAGYHVGAGADPDDREDPFTADGWFRTGDVACVDAGGYHRILGRRSTDLVKSGGYRIGTGEVEASLLAHPAVREVAVVGEPDDDLGAVLVAYVVAHGVDGNALIDFVAGDLAAHKRPRRVELVDALPRNAMGKVNKRALAPEG